MHLADYQYEGVTATPMIDEPTFIILTSEDQSQLAKIKKKLTLRNKSNGFRMMQLRKSIDFMAGRIGYHPHDTAEHYDLEAKLKAARAEWNGLKDSEISIYYEEREDGSLVVPAGYWFLAEMRDDDFHLNTEIKPIALKGTRDYQKAAQIELMKYKRGHCVLATGLGKSFIIMNTCLSMAKVQRRTMVVVPSQDLVEQAVDDIKKVYKSVTGACSGKTPKLGCDIMVVTVGTALKYIDDYDCVIIDESHHGSASTWVELLTNTRAEYVYFFTATPFRGDGMDVALHSLGGPIVFERDVKWGIENDWLCHFDVVVLLVDVQVAGRSLTVNSKTRRASAYKKLLGSPYFLKVLQGRIEAAMAKNRKIMALFKTLPIPKELAKRMEKTVPFKVASATFKKPLRDFKKGESRILVATDKLVSEGVDIPDADLLMVMTQHTSEGMTYQMVGRVLRKNPNKKKPLVLDIVPINYGEFYRVNPIDHDDIQGSLGKRLKIYNKIADSVKIMRI